MLFLVGHAKRGLHPKFELTWLRTRLVQPTLSLNCNFYGKNAFLEQHEKRADQHFDSWGCFANSSAMKDYSVNLTMQIDS